MVVFASQSENQSLPGTEQHQVAQGLGTEEAPVSLVVEGPGLEAQVKRTTRRRYVLGSTYGVRLTLNVIQSWFILMKCFELDI